MIKLNHKYKILFLIVCTLLVTMVWGCSAPKSVPFLPEFPRYERVQSLQIPYPILLLHGLGQKASVWDAQAVRYYERDMGLRFGGICKKVGAQYLIDKQKLAGTADFFTVSFSNPVDSIGAWKNEIEQYIRLVREYTRAEKVILIGYSMGGVTGRYYAQCHPSDHYVQRLISIGSPHQGSPFAKVYQWKTGLAKAAKEGNILTGALLGQALKMMQSLERDVPFDAPAVRDLLRPEDGGVFMRRSGTMAHPLDIEYVSIVGKVEVLKEIERLSASGIQEILRRALETLGFGVEGIFTDGDGVVSAKSQNMTELPWFQEDATRRRISRTVTLSTVHEDHLRNSTEIQRISLEDKPEFKGAEFYRIDNKPALFVEFTDYLPLQKCSVSVTLKTATGRQETISATKEQLTLVRKMDGSIVAQAIVMLPAAFDLTFSFDCEITIKNSFGNQTTTTKRWIYQ